MSASYRRVEETEREREGRRDREGEWTVWTLLARFPCPLQGLDLTSHAIRGSVNQQLGAQMKKCQLLPGAQQADRPRHGAFQHSQDPSSYSQPTTHTHAHTLTECSACTHTHTPTRVSTHSSIEQFLTGFGKRMALSCVAQLDMLL